VESIGDRLVGCGLWFVVVAVAVLMGVFCGELKNEGRKFQNVI
jgi:hypothetical protein